ncbi:hypothetical protein FRC02_009526 [Tulasnella sp. 418]|nr:hypothetical protein FRC02_009526 [Tulasnella sp. 418]
MVQRFTTLVEMVSTLQESESIVTLPPLNGSNVITYGLHPPFPGVFIFDSACPPSSVSSSSLSIGAPETGGGTHMRDVDCWKLPPVAVVDTTALNTVNSGKVPTTPTLKPFSKFG